MKLWLKIVLLNIVIVMSLGILVIIAVRGAVTDAIRTELSREGESLARNLSNRIADSILIDDVYRIEEAIEDVLKTERDVEYVFVTDKDGYLLAHTFKNGFPPDILSWNPMFNKQVSVQLLDTESGFIRDVGLKVFEGMKPELHVGIKEERLTQTLSRIRNLIILLTIIVMLIGSVLSCFTSRLITKPLNQLVDFTHDLAKGDFGKSIEIKSRDEVGELSETFNNLSYELDAYRKKMEESYKQMLRTEKLTALGRLSAGLAHELKNPLTSIRTLFQTFKGNSSLVTKDDIEIVISAADQMNDLLTKFLRFARSDEFNMTDVYINSIIKHVIKLTEFQLKDRSIGLSLELTKLPPLKADRAMIQQAILNLVLNAIEAMHQGGTLTISTRIENGYAFVSVSDTGTGIPEEIRDRIFDPFFTTKPDGTGLGLSIVYNIASLHNGEISFESNGKGTTFILNIPLNV
ncbi:MAG: ATP-binding protein [Thermodesulfovibrionales bacterium]